jgi:outer membrane immunogenic protein
MRNAVIAASALALSALATPAMAQDTAPDSTFSGPRLEGVVGWDHVKDGSGGGGNSDGVVFGANAGYDVQSGNVVVGGEIEATTATTKETTNNFLVAGDEFRVKAGRDLYAGARVGVVVGSKALIYAKGGYTNARISTRYTSGATEIRDGENADGWRIGAGTEVKLGGNLYAKAEYRYSNYGNLDGANIDLDRHQVVGGLGIRF